jgi:hypothetical protein
MPRSRAEDSVRQLLALKPDFPQIACEEFAEWYPPELVERLIEGLRKAGLDTSCDGNVAPCRRSWSSSRTFQGRCRPDPSYRLEISAPRCSGPVGQGSGTEMMRMSRADFPGSLNV